MLAVALSASGGVPNVARHAGGVSSAPARSAACCTVLSKLRCCCVGSLAPARSSGGGGLPSMILSAGGGAPACTSLSGCVGLPAAACSTGSATALDVPGGGDDVEIASRHVSLGSARCMWSTSRCRDGTGGGGCGRARDESSSSIVATIVR